jgi:proline iminopeptidase
MNRRNLSLFTFGIVFLLTWISCSNDPNSEYSTSLWPEIEPYDSGYIKVSEIHEIYYELSGNPDGIPVFVIHGGPGAGCSPQMRRFFNPEHYLIVLHDQRGCGKSKPNGELRDNKTQGLIEDIEHLRVKLDLDKIILFGGSWGSALSVAYAENYPESIKAMVLRGIYLATDEESDLYYKLLTNYFPELAHPFIESLPDSLNELNDLNIYKLFQTEDENERNKYIKLFNRLSIKAIGLHVKDSIMEEYVNSEKNLQEMITMSLIGFHYFANDCFLEEGQLLRDIDKIPDIPVIIVQGRYDMVCPPSFAFKLHKSIPGSKLRIVEEAGHSLSEKPIEAELVIAMKELETLLNYNSDE